MRISQIKFNQFRGFESLELHLPQKGSSVLIGVNGAGKSTILDGIAMLLAKFVEKISGIKYTSLQVQLSDIKDGAPKCDLMIKAHINAGENELSWSLEKSFFRGRSDFSEINTFIETFKTKMLAKEAVNIPIFNYYKVDRNGSNHTSKNKVKKDILIPQVEAYTNAMGSALDYSAFIKWFVEQHNIENQIIKEKQDFNAVNPNLAFIRKAINAFFTSFHEVKYEAFRVGIKRTDAGNISATQTILVQKNGLELEFTQLSDGERGVILLIADIAYRLTLANPSSPNPLIGNGVVLIDEIEQHLHPGWQRSIVLGLEETFPNIQFIFSTHSPQVLSNVHKDHIFILEDFMLLENTPHTFGRDANSILYDIFAVTKRPIHAQKEFDHLYVLMEDPKNLDLAKGELQRMTEKYGPHDTEIVRARTHITFLETT